MATIKTIIIEISEETPDSVPSQILNSIMEKLNDLSTDEEDGQIVFVDFPGEVQVFVLDKYNNTLEEHST